MHGVLWKTTRPEYERFSKTQQTEKRFSPQISWLRLHLACRLGNASTGHQADVPEEKVGGSESQQDTSNLI